MILFTLLTACSPSVDTSCDAAQVFPELFADSTNSDYDDPYTLAGCTDDDTLYVESNGIPTFPFVAMTPTPLSEQDHEWEVTLSPTIAASPTDIPLLGVAGFTVTGLPIYGPNEAADLGWGDPIFDAVVDECLGHTGPQGDYHNHALRVQCITTGTADSTTDDGSAPSPVIGFALDGYPIYGPYGCTDESCTQIIEYQSSWDQIDDDPGQDAWDSYAYSAKSDPEYLDECNGRTQPDGSYGYHATATFPYTLSCYVGTPSEDAGGSDMGPPP